MTNVYGSSMLLTVEANKENIPPGMEMKKEPFVYPEPRVNRTSDPDHDLLQSPVPRPSPAMSQLSDASFLSQDGAAVNTSADEADDDPEITSRKEKSLGLLCQRFLIAINEETVGSSTKEVHLETVARKMSVEKRRIYDIVNVMEALDAMQKTNKSYYQWQGLTSLPRLMSDLQNEAVEEGLPERVLRVEQAMCSFTELASPSARSKTGFKDIVGSFVGCTSTPTTPSTSSESVAVKNEPIGQEKKSRVDSRDRQGRNSLAQLCRRFLMVLLSNPKNVRKVSLDVASTVLIKDPETEGFEPPSRSRCRRLYDIANVLVALGLIKKVHYLFGTKKIPLFVYCGPEPDVNGSFDVFSSVERLLSSPQNIPQTPVIKAQTDKIVQQIAGFGKRTYSEQSLSKPLGNVPKMAKMKSEKMTPMSPVHSSLFMIADLATAEKMRLEALAQLSRSLLGSSAMVPPSPQMPSSGVPPLPVAPLQLPNLPELPKPQAQKQFSFPAVDPKTSFSFADYTPAPYSPSTLRPLVSQMTFKRSPLKTTQLGHRPMHLMSNILGESKKFKNNENTNSFEHTNSSPFQVVKKGETRPKKVFGEIQNFQ